MESVTNAVKDISFNIEAGEITVIVGESGSGKSITSLSILQLLPKQAIAKGEILFSKQNKAPIDLLPIITQRNKQNPWQRHRHDFSGTNDIA